MVGVDKGSGSADVTAEMLRAAMGVLSEHGEMRFADPGANEVLAHAFQAMLKTQPVTMVTSEMLDAATLVFRTHFDAIYSPSHREVIKEIIETALPLSGGVSAKSS